MVIAEFSFIHHGFSGLLSVSEPNLVKKIQKNINLGQRLELFLMLVSLLLDESVKNRVNTDSNYTLMELMKLYELSNSSVVLSNGLRLRIV